MLIIYVVVRVNFQQDINFGSVLSLSLLLAAKERRHENYGQIVWRNSSKYSNMQTIGS